MLCRACASRLAQDVDLEDLFSGKKEELTKDDFEKLLVAEQNAPAATGAKAPKKATWN